MLPQAIQQDRLSEVITEYLRTRDGDLEREIVEGHLRLVHSFVRRRYSGVYAEEMEDRLSVANMRLVETVHNIEGEFDHPQKFTSYIMVCIVQDMKAYYYRNRLFCNNAGTCQKLNGSLPKREEFPDILGSNRSPDELCELKELKEQVVRDDRDLHILSLIQANETHTDIAQELGIHINSITKRLKAMRARAEVFHLDEAKRERSCLKCSRSFQSLHKGNKLCKVCQKGNSQLA